MTEPTRQVKVQDLTPDHNNANKGTARGGKLLKESLERLGAGRSILLDREGRIIAGNKTAREAAEAGLDDVIVIQTDGSQLVAVQRTDLDLETDPRARELAFADNRIAEIDLDYERDAFLASGNPNGTDLTWLFSDAELAKLANPDEAQRAKELAAEVSSEEEYQEARERADSLGERVATKLKELAEKHPRAMNSAVAVAVPLGNGTKCLVWSDRACGDVLAEIQRYAELGEASPLARLAEGMNPL